MKRFGRRFVLFCAVVLLLAGSASANSAAPDYLVVVKVANGPGEPYRLELLREDNGQAIAEESAGEDGVHRFRGYDMPGEFRVRIVTESGETWESEVLRREALQVGVRVDWEAGTARVPPVWGAYALQFLSTLLPTLAIEALVLLLFRYDWRKNWKPFLLVNLVTQGALAAYLSYYVTRSGLSGYSAVVFSVILIPAEAVILIVEALAYRRFLRGHSKARAVGCAAAANLLSYAAGWFVVQAVWEGVTKVFWLGV